MAEQKDAELIEWLACERKASLKVWDHFPDVPAGGAALSMLEVSSRYNLLVAATPTGLYVSSVSEMLTEAYRLHELELEGQELPTEAMARQLGCANTLRLERELGSSSAAIHAVVLSRSEEWVAVASGDTLLLYSCSDLQRRTSTAKPRLRARFEEEILACEWATEGDDRLLLATRSGLHVVAWDEEMQAASIPPLQFGVKGTVTCATWLSADLVMCGLNGNKACVTDVQTGKGWTLKLAPKDAFEDEEEEDAGAIRSIVSFGDGAVAVGFSEGERMCLFLQLSEDMKSVTEWTNLSTAFFQDTELPWGPGLALHRINQQQLAVLSCQTADGTVFAQWKDGKWTPLEFDDTSVLPMPQFVREDIIGDEEDITTAALVGVSYCNTAVPGDHDGGLPHIFLLSTEGILEVWSMKNNQQDPELIFGSALPITTVQESLSVTVKPAKNTPSGTVSSTLLTPADPPASSPQSAPLSGVGASSPSTSPFAVLGAREDSKGALEFGKSSDPAGGATAPRPTTPFGSSSFQPVGSTRAAAKSSFDFGKPPGATKEASTAPPAGATREEAKKTFDFGKPPGTGLSSASAPAIAQAGATREAAKSTFDFGKPPGASTPAVSPFGAPGSTRDAAKSSFDFGKPPGAATKPPADGAAGGDKPGATREAAKSIFDFGKPPGTTTPAVSPFGDAGSTRASAKSTFDFGKPPGANTPASSPFGEAGSTRAAAKSTFDFGKPPGTATKASVPKTATEPGATRAAAKSTFDFGKPPGASNPAVSPFGEAGSTREAAKNTFDFGKPPGASKVVTSAPATPQLSQPGSTREAAKSSFDFGKPPGASKVVTSTPATPQLSQPGSTREAAKSSFDFGKPPGAAKPASGVTTSALPSFADPGSTRAVAKSTFDFGKPPGAKASAAPATAPSIASSGKEVAKSSFDFGKSPGAKSTTQPVATTANTAAVASPKEVRPKAHGRDALQFTFGAELSDQEPYESDEERPVRRAPAAMVYDDPIQQWAEDLFTSEVAAFEEELQRVDELSVAMDDRTAILMEGRSMERIHSALEQVGSLYKDMQATRSTMERMHNRTHSLAERFVEGPFAVFKHAEALLVSMDHIMASPPPSLDPATAATRSLLARKTTAMLKQLEEVRRLLGNMQRRHTKGLGELGFGRPRSAEELYTAMYHLHGSMSALATQVEELGARLRRWRRKSEKRARALDCCSGSFSPCSPTPASLRSPATHASRSRLVAIERALGKQLSFSPGTPRVVARTPSVRSGRRGREQKKEGRDPLDVRGLTQGTPEVFAPATLATMSKSPATPSARTPASHAGSPWACTGGQALQTRPDAAETTPLTAASQLAKKERPSLERTFSWPKGEQTEDSPSFSKPYLPVSDSHALSQRRDDQGFLSPASAADKTKSAPHTATYEEPLKSGDESPDARKRSASLKAKEKRRSELFSSSGSVPTMSAFALSSEGAFSFASVNKSTPIQSEGFLRQSAFSGWDSAAPGAKQEEDEEEDEEEDSLFFTKRGGNLSSSDSVTLKEAFSSSGRGDLKSSLEGKDDSSETKKEGRGSTVVEVSSGSDEDTEEYSSDEGDTKTSDFSDSSSDGEVVSTVFSVTSEKGKQSAPSFFGSPSKQVLSAEEDSEEDGEEENGESSSASSRFSFGESSFSSGEGLSKSFGVSLSSKEGDFMTKSAPATDSTSLVKSSGLLGAGGGSFASVSVSAGGLSDSWVNQSKGGSSDMAAASTTSPFGSGSLPLPFSSQEGKPEASSLFGGTPTRDPPASTSAFGSGSATTSTFDSGSSSAFGAGFGSTQDSASAAASGSSFSAFGSSGPARDSASPSAFGGAGVSTASSDPFASFGAPKAAGGFGQASDTPTSIFGTTGAGGATFGAPATSPAASPFTAGSRAPGAASTQSAFGQSSALSLGPSFGTPNAAAMTSAAAVGASAPLFGGGGQGQGQATFSSFSAAPATSPNVFGGGGGGSGFTPPPATSGSLWAPRK